MELLLMIAQRVLPLGLIWLTLLIKTWILKRVWCKRIIHPPVMPWGRCQWMTSTVQRQTYPRDAMIFSRLATKTIFGQGCNKQILVLTFLIISWLPLSCKATFKWERSPAFQIIYLFMQHCAGKLSCYDLKLKLLSGSVQYMEKTWVTWKSFVISFLFYTRKDYNKNLDEDDLSHCKEKKSILIFSCVWIYAWEQL